MNGPPPPSAAVDGIPIGRIARRRPGRIGDERAIGDPADRDGRSMHSPMRSRNREVDQPWKSRKPSFDS